MESTAHRAVAIVGVGAILPDAPDAAAFWRNVKEGRYSISDVTANRWDPALYYDPDPKAPEKTYSKIGGWVREWEWNPRQWGLPIPPRVIDAMDDGQKWAVACTRAVLADYGYPGRPLDAERTAVILGNAMAGEKHYLTALRVYFPEYAAELDAAASFAALPAAVRAAIRAELHAGVTRRFPPVSEDSMPGELANCIAGRIANLFNFHGPNFVVDAACASAMAAVSAAVEGLTEHDYDAVIAGGVDRNMGASSYVKFCKIGALSATGTRPYADGADGFVMGEGAAIFVLKRLADAERAGDKIYAVVRGVGGSSDGRGKGITAPNPVGQRLCIQRAWENAGLSPATATMVEGHGTSTRVGDVVEVESLTEIFAAAGAAPASVALGSVKSNIGHLKAAAGAAGLLKAVLALNDKVIPPSLHFDRPNPNIDFAHSPFYVNSALAPWPAPPGGVRRAGVSAFGFGGTNFHLVLEEHIPGRLARESGDTVRVQVPASGPPSTAGAVKAPLRGALVLGAESAAALVERLRVIVAAATAGRAPEAAPPAEADLRAPERVAIDYGDAAELADKGAKALKALQGANPAMWKALRAQGIHRGHGPAPKVAFLYTGQGSQYVNMLRRLAETEPIVRDTFAEADQVMTPLLGKPLRDYVFAPDGDPAALARAEEGLRQTEVTQPAVLTVDAALTRMLAAYGIVPDMVMGHSLGEYGALVAAHALPFADALEAVSARGREMANLSIEDNGKMAAVFAPIGEIERILKELDGYVVIANVNSNSQAVIGGASSAVDRAVAAFQAAGFNAVELPVSHAFHTAIVSPASEPLRRTLERLHLQPAELSIVANVTGDPYPVGPGVVPEMIDLLARQVASPVQFVKGLHTLYAAGARVFVEVGPKKALQGFVDDVLADRPDVTSLFTNHPKLGDEVAFNQALCGLYAAGVGVGHALPASVPEATRRETPAESATPVLAAAAPAAAAPPRAAAMPPASAAAATDRYVELGRLFAEFLERGREIYFRAGPAPAVGADPVVITGAALGLPGTANVFDDDNVGRILHGEQFIDVIPTRIRRAMLDKHITRLVKSDDGDPHFESIDDPADVIKLAARAGGINLARDFGVSAERLAALDIATCLAIGAGLDALRDAGIPLVLHYRTTTKGTQLPDRWQLPEALRDETGVIFASAFPGYDAFAAELRRHHEDRARRETLALLEDLRVHVAPAGDGAAALVPELDRRIHDLRTAIDRDPYHFDRRFLFRILAMGHSQFAEHIGARGPNTQLNAACASTTQAVAVAEDWIRAGRCRRVIIIAGDDVTSDHLLEWIGAGFLASGAAATDDVVEEAALPFDRRRHGMLLGMGAAALVVESAEAARERGIRPICEVLGAVTANSAFHGTRLDVHHISAIMEALVAQAEQRAGIRREQIAPETVFVSHETYTPARGGSAAAEVEALRHVFGDAASRIVVANTKGFTGHPMGVGIEDVVAIKALETGLVPPVPNFKEIDPELGQLNLSRGGTYPIRYALRLGAGFGSQISMTLIRWTRTPDGTRPSPDALGYASRVDDAAVLSEWLRRVSGQTTAELEVVQRTLRIKDIVGSRQYAVGSADQIVGSGRSAVGGAEKVESRESRVESPEVGGGTGGELPTAYRLPPTDPIKDRVLALVAEKTGYPPDMLDLDLDLEADLGVDTVKQAEVFATIREAYGIPRDTALKLRDFPTLAHVIRFVQERRPDLAVGSKEEVESRESRVQSPEVGGGTGGELPTAYRLPPTVQELPTAHRLPPTVQELPTAHRLLPTDALPRRVPVAVLRPPFELCKPTGVRLGSDSRVIVMPDEAGVAKALRKRLEKLGAHVYVIDPSADADALSRTLETWKGEGAVQGVYWLAALDDEGELSAMDLNRWRAALERRVKRLYVTMRCLYEQIAMRGTFLVCGTRMGGRHGYDDGGALAPMGGAVAGFAKAYKRERPEALVKVADFGGDAKAGDIADALMAETLTDSGAVEVGHHGGQRWTVSLAERRLAPSETGREELTRGRDSVFVITGAAGGIVSAIIADLAAASGGTFHLLDKVAQPDPANPDLARFVSDREGLKRDLFERIKARGERATPALVERELGGLERAQAALAAINAVRAAGGTVHYHAVDLTDPEAVASVIDTVRRASGRIDALVHAAGIEVSHFLPDKAAREFDLVFDVKCDGWFNLLHAVGSMPLGATVVFSSIAGRFGNGGQTDYSAANDLLCRMTSHLRRARVETRALAIDWTAWGGIGMATRGSIPAMMQAAGIDMLAPEAGIPVVWRELAAGTRDEVVIAERLGVLADEWDDTGGLDPSALAVRLADRSGPMIGTAVRMGIHDGLVVETTLDPAVQPFLHDHQIDGIPVLPGVMGLEAFAEVAQLMLPAWHVVGIENVEFLAPFKFYRGAARTVTIRALFRTDGDDVVADCRLLGERTLAGQTQPQTTTHFAAAVRLARRAPTPVKVTAPNGAPRDGATPADIYRVYFHGPAYQVVERAWREGDQAVGQLTATLPANHDPADAPLALEPRLVELCFQTAGLWELGTRGRMALPQRIERVSVYRRATRDGQPVFALVTPRASGDGFDARVVDCRGNVQVSLAGYNTVELPTSIDEERLAPLRRAMAGDAAVVTGR